MEKKITLGMADYEGLGPVNACELYWEMGVDSKGRPEFSGSAGIWDTRRGDYRDYLTCGQCVDTVCGLFPDDAFAQRFLAVWREYHLNGMNAGTPAQTAALEPVKDTFSRLDWFVHACVYLDSVGLQPDPNGPEGKPYSYGSAWLYREIPPEIVAEIEGWAGSRA